jgi:hypothetical protein
MTAVFWDTASDGLLKLIDVSQMVINVRAMMKAVSTSETSVNFNQITRCNIPSDSHLHTRRRENLK